jgi:hypothetical protein
MAAEDDFASIVVPSARWRDVKLSDSSRFSQLHSRFWGKSMEMEERHWVQNNPSIPKAYSQGAKMDVDGDTDSDTDAEENFDRNSDDDFIPGCHVLDTAPFPEGKIWIRAEFIRIFDYILKYFERDDGALDDSPKAVILTGQPGIGECQCRASILIIDLLPCC